ncbi:hypothetical protein [Tsukamurella paurometabola]|uniref:Uncharacterized protein n=1 Tax=Tsukamurella paurometabola TaxID=2061 RepID=A0A3P8JV47_TSUPA|nr:hypothetical protein [Tsukamurella paurometabola]MBS4100778.1 hypothetical protein [Tsukamurella paurometabola]UEA84635.1 hypothetical protein LK411_07400 [Tsukamurella paurometabola]VDR37209.1 Uncharacterised protein [Tsukamurella paurometabola]
MTEHYANPTPEEARSALARADRASVATPADRDRLERGLITIGLAVGALVPALRVTVGNPDAPGWFRLGGLAVVVLLYLAAIAIAVAGMRRASAAPRGFTLRYHLGLGGTMALYAGYVVLQSARGEDALAWHWTITAALVTTIPALLGARAISKLALR